MMPTKKPVVLIVLDGWGYREEKEHNAIAEAKTPYFDHLWNTYPHALLEASGLAVGMPEGQIGNSEVCHMTIGAGTTLDTDLVRINKAAGSGQFENNDAFRSLFEHTKKNNSCLHAIGLISPGGVHSHQDHLFAFLRAAKQAGVKNVAIHAITDGRDVAPQSAHHYLKQLEDLLAELRIGRLASVCGRYYAMDRDQNWDRTELYLKLILEGKGRVIANTSTPEFIASLHQNGQLELDELLVPHTIADNEETPVTIKNNDGVFFFNFRSDRAKQLSQKINELVPKMDLRFVTMTGYDQYDHVKVAFSPAMIETTLAKEISAAGLSQAHIAETEKFAHATYYLNGGVQETYPGEKQILIESRKDIKTHDEAPAMKAAEIADAAIKEIEAGTDFIFINFANADMVGHTANKEAILEALEKLDAELKRVTEAALAQGGVVFVTADHGNAELNVDPVTGAKHTAHTINPVPAIVTDTNLDLHSGSLSDIAPAILNLLGLPKPAGMTGKSLLK